MTQVVPDAKEIRFTRSKRKELFPVKEEHKDPPCSYLDSNFTTFNPQCKAIPNNIKRAFQQTIETKPGPGDYNPHNEDLPRRMTETMVPLSAKRSF
jgi:hypothetical protein